MAEVEATEAVGGVGGQAVDGVGVAGAAGAADPAADGVVSADGVAAAGGGEGVEGSSEVAVVGEGDGAGDAGCGGGGVLGAGGVGGGDQGEDAAGLGGEFDVPGVGEVEAVVAGRGDEDDVGLGGGVGDLIEGGEEACAFASGEVGGGSDGEADDVGVVGDGVVDALHDPAKETVGLAFFALLSGGFAGDAAGHALEDFDVEDGCARGDADDQTGAGTDGGGGERGGPGAVALLVLRGAVVAGAGVGGLVDLAEVEGEVGGDVGVGGVDAAVENGDADAFAGGGVPWAVRGATGDVVAVAADLLDGPALRGGGVEGVVCRRGWRRRRGGECDGFEVDGAVGGQFADGGAGGGRGGAVDGADRCDGADVVLDLEAVRGEDAVVQDVGDAGLGGQEAEGGGVVLRGLGLDGGDAEVGIALEETGSCRGDTSFGVVWDGSIAIDDEIAMRGEAGGVDLGAGERRDGDGQDDACEGLAGEKSGPGESDAAENGHGCTSLLH